MTASNRNNLAITTLALCSLLIAFSGSHPTSATGGYTSAPGDGVCAQCHSGNNTSLDGDYTVNGIPDIIEANTTYTVEIQLTNPNGNASRGGFQILALDEENTQGGEWSNAGAGSILKTASGKTYLGHQGNQPFPTENELTWTADWTSPNEQDAVYNFYAVSILGNGGNGNQNDRFLLEQFSATIPIMDIPLLLSVDLLSDATCMNSTDGSAMVSIDGGVSPYEIIWSNGESTETATMLPPSLVSVSVTDANGTSQTAEIEINFSVELALDILDKNDVSCFGELDGDIEVSLIDGAEPITYEWSNGDTGNSIENLEAGVYTVLATDANHCDASLDITISQPSDFIIDANIVNPTCSTDQNGSIHLDVSGDSSPYLYLWEDGSQNDSLINLAPGIYLTTITDANGCSKEISNEIMETPPIDFTNALIESPLCTLDSTGSISLMPTSANVDYQYLWNNDSTSQSISGLTIGDYIVTITNSTGCFLIDTFTLTSQTNIILEFANTAETSLGANDGSATAIVIFGEYPPYSFDWSTGDTTSMINNLSTGNYSVTVTDGNGCMTNDTIAITSGGCNLISQANVSPISCKGENDGVAIITLENAMGPITYLWSDGSILGDRTDLEPDTFNVIVTDSLGCQDTINNIVITEPTELLVQIEVLMSNACSEEDSGILEALVMGGTPSYSFLWSNTDSLNLIDSLPNNQYIVTVTDANGCSTVAEAMISSIDNEPPTLNMQDVVVYADSSGFNEVLATQFDNGSIDNCSSVEFSFLTEPMIGCEFFSPQNLSIIGTDSLNNSDTVEVQLTLIDTLPPWLLSGGLDMIELDGCEPVIFDFPVFTDNCADSVFVEQLTGFPSGQIFPSGLTEQLYSITDGSGNETLYSFTVNVTSDLEAEITSTPAICFEQASGFINIILSGTHEPYVQDSSIVNTGLFAGGYFISILDTVGCQIFEIVNIEEPSELNAQLFTIAATTNTSTDGEISILVGGGTEPYNISLFDGQGGLLDMNMSGNFSDLLAGNYTVLVEDGNGCEVNVENIEIAFTTSTLDLFDIYNITSYPNPVHHELIIDIGQNPSNILMKIMAIDGKLIWSAKGNSGIQKVNLSNQAPGLYLLSIHDQKGSTVRKISLQH